MVVSLCSLFVVRAPIFRGMALGAAVVVTVTPAAAWTLLPAVLAALGLRVERGPLPRRWQPADARSDADAVRGGWSRWAAAVMRRPVLAAGMVIAAAAGGRSRRCAGGPTAQYVDLSAETRSALPAVLGISLVFLLAVFRSVLMPVKAVLMNLLATGAALGLLVLVFQFGVGASLLGYTSTGFIQVYLPLTVFVLLFGLSTDYKVFLIGRMRESWTHVGDNTVAVATGVQHTARPISAVAAEPDSERSEPRLAPPITWTFCSPDAG